MAKSSSARAKAAERDPGAEIATLRDMSQAAAAWLLGVNGRSLRDSNCPRNPGGSYNAADVLQWRLDRPKKAISLDDRQYEAVLNIVDKLGEHIGAVREGIAQLVRELGPGDDVLGLIFRALLDDWDSTCRLYPQFYKWGGHDVFHKYIVCRKCRRVRRGRRWVAMDVPSTAKDIRDAEYCDDCNRRIGIENPGRHDWPLIGETDGDFQATATT